MIDRLKAAVEADERIAYALLFGSAATGRASSHNRARVPVFRDGRPIAARGSRRSATQ